MIRLSSKLWKTKFLKISRLVLAIVLISSWIFSGWPQVFNFPPDVKVAKADVATGDGKIIYGEGTVTDPRTRNWTGTFSAEGNTIIAAATIRHIIVKASPVRDEMIAGIQTTGGVLYIQRWNGIVWSNEWNVTVGDGNLPRFDIAYERSTGDAMVVYSTNTGTTNEMAYNIWNGSTWAGAVNYDAVRTSGIVQGIALATVGGISNDFAMAWGDANLDLSANYWDGTNNVWKTEPSAALSTGLDTLAAATSFTNWSFDLDFELSGQLLIAWGNAAATDIAYVTRAAGAAGAWGTVSTATAFAEQSDDLELSADPNSDQMILVHTGSDSGNDTEAAVWDGTAFPTTIDTAIPCAANVVCGIDATVDTTGIGTSGNAAGWLKSGANTRGIVTYDDANAVGVDWAVWDSTNGWVLQTDCTTACSSQPASGDDKLHRIRQNPFNGAEFMAIFVDTGSDLWAKKLTFDGTNLTWSSADGGTALELTTSSITGFAADFAFNRFIPTPTFTQSAYRLFNNLDSTDVGTALVAQDTAATLGSTGAAFRLRILLHIGANQLIASGQLFKLQFATQSGTCDTGFVGETYADVTAATVVAYNNNATPADDATLTANANDPTHGADTIVNQTYEELNTFTNSVAAIPSGQDGEWDFALFDNGATASTAYCLRAVKSDGTVLDTYTQIPQITTAAAAPAQSLSFSISDPSIGFGSLSASVARFASGDTLGSAAEVEAHTLSASTNATGGYVVTVRGATLTHTSNGSFTITAIGGTNTASSPGTEQFGLRATVSSGTGTITSPYGAAGFAYATTSSTESQVASGTGDGASTVYSVRYIANIATPTEAGNYSTTLNYVVTATF
ncbi:MAG: hypothetical protein AAB351_03415 [Patescibacteria group bacterium]